MKQWEPSQTAFDRFLDLLDPDRETAGRQYEILRTRVVKFFEWRACRHPEGLADEAIDRMIRRMESGENITDPFKYASGVARFVFLESLKAPLMVEEISEEIAAPRFDSDSEDEVRLRCLEKCLGELPERSRTMILNYYREDRGGKVDGRQSLADELGVSINALRIKVLRIRSALEKCVLKCAS